MYFLPLTVICPPMLFTPSPVLYKSVTPFSVSLANNFISQAFKLRYSPKLPPAGLKFIMLIDCFLLALSINEVCLLVHPVILFPEMKVPVNDFPLMVKVTGMLEFDAVSSELLLEHEVKMVSKAPKKIVDFKNFFIFISLQLLSFY